MKRRFLFPIVIATALALSACAGGAPASPGTPAAPPVGSGDEQSEAPADTGNQTSEEPNGAEATVTIGDHVYEFSSNPALTWGKATRYSCYPYMNTLQLNLPLVAIDGHAVDEGDGRLNMQVSNPGSASLDEVNIEIKAHDVEYVAGAALTIVDVQGQPITLTRDGFTISGSQDVYNRVYSAPDPRVVTAQIDARCVDF